ncbi:MAG: alpha/beta hydrolase [Clostridia bacterium]|nr:alpha/beta hydrolase [Clostridia bacterium]
MKKGVKFAIGTVMGASAVLGAAGYIAFMELMSNKAKLTPYLGKLFDKPGEGAIEFDDSKPDERKEWFFAQELERHELLSERGERLRGYLLKADEPSDVYVFCIHGYRGEGKTEFRYSAKFFHDKGYNVFLVDHQAAGESDGTYITFGHYEHRNCLKWLEYLNDVYGKNIRIIIYGISMGSATAMLMTGNEKLPENVRFTIADCGYTSMWNEISHNLNGIGKLKAPVLGILNGINRAVLGFDFKDVNPIDAIKNAKIPMLFIHGSADDFVPCFMVHELYDACASEHKEKLIIKNAAHGISYMIDSETYENKVNEFIGKYL